MPRLRLTLVLSLLACAALLPWAQSEKHGELVKPARAESVEEPAPVPAPPEPRPFGLLARFGDARVRHPADRFCFSADGRRMFASGGAAAHTWDLSNGRLLASFPVVPASPLWGPGRAAMSPDGRWAITSSTFDMRSVVRDAETGQVAGDPAQHEDRLVAGLDGSGRVWLLNRHTGEFASYPLPAGPPGPVVLTTSGFTLASPDGRWLASSSGRGSLQIRDLRAADAGWVELESYRDQPFPACGRVPPACAVPVRFSPDGRFLLTWWRGFNLWHLAERRVVRLTTVRDQTRWCPDATFTPDGRRLMAVVTESVTHAEEGQPGHVRVWETASGSEAFRFEPPGGATGCAFTPDGKRLIVAHPDATFSAWDYAALEAQAVRAAGETWQRLASREAKTGLGAIDALVSDPTAVAYLRECFRPADAARVEQLIAELGNSDYATREAAEKGLAALGERAEKALLEAVTKSPSPEVRSRAGRLLAPISGTQSPARLRAARAVEALERIGTPGAKELLSEWAQLRGPAHAAEAKAALARLAPSR